jgi:hypothetical protein
MLSAVRTFMLCLCLGLGLVVCAACGGSIVSTPGSESNRYNQTWTKSYGLTTCGDWNDVMTDAQQWRAAVDMLTSARKKWDDDEGLPSDSLVTRFQGDITDACAVDNNHQLPEIAVGVYLTDRDRYSP